MSSIRPISSTVTTPQPPTACSRAGKATSPSAWRSTLYLPTWRPETRSVLASAASLHEARSTTLKPILLSCLLSFGVTMPPTLSTWTLNRPMTFISSIDFPDPDAPVRKVLAVLSMQSRPMTRSPMKMLVNSATGFFAESKGFLRRCSDVSITLETGGMAIEHL